MLGRFRERFFARRAYKLFATESELGEISGILAVVFYRADFC
jgi:hypothetical protein